jgi:hypothetical protein
LKLLADITHKRYRSLHTSKRTRGSRKLEAIKVAVNVLTDIHQFLPIST